MTKQIPLKKSGEVADQTGGAIPAVEPPPGVRTLLDFVAWVVYTHERQTLQKLPSGWLKGRGGFLSDSLTAVQEAGVRVQASLCPWYLEMPKGSRCSCFPQPEFGL